jgi:hypothetical protein
MSDVGEIGQDLVIIPAENAYSVFVEQANIEPYLTKVRTAVSLFQGDTSTANGREEIRSMARKVTKIKTYIEGVGKTLAAEQKEVPKKIDAKRKHAWDILDALADNVRKPLTDWEAIEAARVKKHTDMIGELESIKASASSMDMGNIRESLAFVAAVQVGPECEEFEDGYSRLKAAAESVLAAALEKAEKAEADRIELDALRKKQADRDEADRIAELERVAAAKATADAEEAARVEAAKVAAKAQADLDAAEQAKKTAADAAQAEIDRLAAKAKADSDAAAARELALTQAAEQAQQAARDTEARLKREADDAAAKLERDRVAREADTKHKAAVNRAALAAFVEGGIDADTAKKVIALIAKKMIPSVTISY